MQNKIVNRSVMFVLLSAILLGSFYNTNVFAKSLAKITLKVTDESGKAIPHARVRISFLIFTKGGWASETKEEAGYTDAAGNYSASALSDNDIGFNVTNDGFYQTFGDYKFKDSSLGHWQPWNPEIIVVLRKIEKPVPMYMRDTKMMRPVLEIPVSGKEIGLDLMDADWVAPFGAGRHPDMYFKLDRKFVSNNDFDGTLTITFPNKYDGIQLVKYDRRRGSNFKLPRYAPEAGYKSQLILKFGKKPSAPFTGGGEEDNNFFIRVRSEEKDGKYYRAMFGKIYGNIEFDMRGHKTASILLKYFLNPDYTRNLESGVNLLKLPSREIFNPN